MLSVELLKLIMCLVTCLIKNQESVSYLLEFEKGLRKYP